MELLIEKVLVNRFEFSLDGGTIISESKPKIYTYGTKCAFHTSTGANIIKKQNVDVTEVLLRDTYGETGDFTFSNVIQLWTKLIDLGFFDNLGGGVGATSFQDLSDTTAFFGNNGKVPIVNEALNKLDYTTFYNLNKLTQMSDVSISSLIDGKILGITLVGGVPKVTMINKPTDGTTYFSAVGGFVYSDLETQTTPLAYTSGSLLLVNDKDGDDTFTNEHPYGVTNTFDVDNNKLDFSQLSIGDEVFLTVALNTTTDDVNQISALKIILGEGTDNEREIYLDNDINHKDAATHNILREINFTIENNDWKNTQVGIYFESNGIASVSVNYFKVYIVRKSINLLDIEVSLPPIHNTYVDADALFADQANQLEDFIYEITNGFGFAGVLTGETIWVRYTGGVTGTLDDYTFETRAVSRLDYGVAYIGYPDANNATAEIGNQNKSWETPNQALLDCMGLGLQYIKFDVNPDFTGTLAITSQFTGFVQYEIKTNASVIDLTANTNATLHSGTQPARVYFNAPNAKILDNGATGTTINADLIPLNVDSVRKDNDANYMFDGFVSFEKPLRYIEHGGAVDNIVFSYLANNSTVEHIELITSASPIVKSLVYNIRGEDSSNSSNDANVMINVDKINDETANNNNDYKIVSDGNGGYYYTANLKFIDTNGFLILDSDSARFNFINATVTKLKTINAGFNIFLSGNILSTPIFEYEGTGNNIIFQNLNAEFNVASYFNVGTGTLRAKNSIIKLNSYSVISVEPTTGGGQTTPLEFENSEILQTNGDLLVTGDNSLQNIIWRNSKTNSVLIAENAEINTDVEYLLPFYHNSLLPDFKVVEEEAGTTKTLSYNDHGKHIVFTSSSPITFTVDTLLKKGLKCTYSQKGVGVVTLAGAGITFEHTTTLTTVQGETKKICITGVDTCTVDGDPSFTSYTETDPIFTASEAFLFEAGDKANLDNQSNVNSGDETAGGIKTKYESNADTNAYTDAEKSKLASITAIFTTALKSSYDSTVTWISTNGTNLLNHLSNTANPHNVTKTQVGLGNADNTSDIDKPVSTAQQTALNLKEDKSNKGIANGYAPLNNLTKIAYSYLDIVNDVITGGTTSLLSAEQGKYLKTQIDAINTLLSSDNVNLDNVQEIVDAIETIQISLSTILVNDLTTGGTTEALTAEMGKQLNIIKEDSSNKIISDIVIGDLSSDSKYPAMKRLARWLTGAGGNTPLNGTLTVGTTIADTDEVYYQENTTTGFWQRISFANFKTTLANTFKTWILNINLISGTTYSVGLTDYKTKNVFTSNYSVALTVPTGLPIGAKFSYTVKGNGTVTISGSGITFVQTMLSFTTGRSFTLEIIGTNECSVSGDVDANGIYYNTILIGIQSYVTTKYALRTLLLKENGNAWTDADADLYISNFRIVGTEVRCFILLPYKHANSAFAGGNTNGTQLLTHYYDYDGRCTSMGYQVFRGNANVQVLEFYGMRGDISQFQIEGCVSITKAIFPLATKVDFNGLLALNKFNVDGCETFLGFQNCAVLPTTLLSHFPKVRFLTSQNAFSGTPVQKVYFPELGEAGGFQDATTMIEIEAPNVKKITNQFRNTNAITTLSFPLCTYVAPVARMFEMDAVTLIYLPNCKTFGTSGTADDMFSGRSGSWSTCTLVVNEYLKTSNAGGVNANIADAIAKGINVKYASDYPVTQSTTVKDSLGNTLGSFNDFVQVENINWDNINKRLTATLVPSSIAGFDEAAQDAVGTILTDSSTIDFTYNDAGASITAVVIDGSITDSKLSTGINANKIGDGSVSNTEFQYLDGLTSSVQTQLNTKSSIGLAAGLAIALG